MLTNRIVGTVIEVRYWAHYLTNTTITNVAIYEQQGECLDLKTHQPIDYKEYLGKKVSAHVILDANTQPLLFSDIEFLP